MDLFRKLTELKFFCSDKGLIGTKLQNIRILNRYLMDIKRKSQQYLPTLDSMSVLYVTFIIKDGLQIASICAI